MQDRRKIEQLVHELHSARVDGQLDALCALFTSDAHFRIAGASAGKPIAIAAQGSTEIRAWLAIMLKTFRLSDYAAVSMVIEETKASVFWRANILSKITGVLVATELVDLIEIRDGRVSSYIEFFVPV